MTIKKPKLIKSLAVALCCTSLITTIGISSVIATEYTEKQKVASEIANLARSIGLDESDPIIVRAQEIWCSEASAQPTYNIVINEDEAVALAKMAWGEARGCSDMEVAATMWCVLNRVDAGGGSVVGVITAPYQFSGYGGWCPVEPRFYNLAVDVLTRWQKEKQGAPAEEVGRVLPKDYKWFSGDGAHNYFRNAYSGGSIWNWSLPNPYGGV